MEVVGVASAFPAVAYAEARPARTEARVSHDAASPRARVEADAERAVLSVTEARDAKAVNETELAREAREERERLANATAGGSFQFEMEGKTRVMKVLDSRDVLIYQVPPQGVLELIEARDREPPPQVRTRV